MGFSSRSHTVEKKNRRKLHGDMQAEWLCCKLKPAGGGLEVEVQRDWTAHASASQRRLLNQLKVLLSRVTREALDKRSKCRREQQSKKKTMGCKMKVGARTTMTTEIYCMESCPKRAPRKKKTLHYSVCMTALCKEHHLWSQFNRAACNPKITHELKIRRDWSNSLCMSEQC